MTEQIENKSEIQHAFALILTDWLVDAPVFSVANKKIFKGSEGANRVNTLVVTTPLVIDNGVEARIPMRLYTMQINGLFKTLNELNALEQRLDNNIIKFPNDLVKDTGTAVIRFMSIIYASATFNKETLDGKNVVRMFYNIDIKV